MEKKNNFVRNFLVVWAVLNIVMIPLAFANDEEITNEDKIFNKEKSFGAFAKVIPVSIGYGINENIKQTEETEKNNRQIIYFRYPINLIGILFYALCSTILVYSSFLTKKSQMEIIGLALIVILIIVALLFYIKFSVFAKKIDQKEPFRQTQTASNMLSALVRVKPQNCSFNSLSELIQDCAENSDEASQVLCDDGNRSCVYLNNTIEYIFNMTLNSWGNMSYRLNICKINSNSFDCGGGGDITKFENGNCGASENIDSKQSFIKLRSGDAVMVKLDICERPRAS